MMANKYKRLIPQQRYEFETFVRQMKSRHMKTNDLRYVLVLLREITREIEFVEWGSAIAHVKRNQGWLFQNAISIWATHVFYESLNSQNVRLSPLPADIIDAIISHLEDLSSREIYNLYGHLVSQGTTANEIIATINHLYSRPRFRRKRREIEAFYHFVCEAGIDESDEFLLKYLVRHIEDKALSIGPRPLSEIVMSIEQAICLLGVEDCSLNQDDKDFLQLHLLVALHGQVIDINPREFQCLTGHPLGVHKTILFISSVEDVLTLDVGFFEQDEYGAFQPAPIRRSHSIFRVERFSYPVISSNLSPEVCLAETDENVRYSLHDHSVKVVKKNGRFQIAVGSKIPEQEWFLG